MQHKLESATRTVLTQFKFRHREMMLQKVFFAAEGQMDEESELFQRPHVGRGFRLAGGKCGVTHSEVTFGGKSADVSPLTNLQIAETRETCILLRAS